MDRRGFFKLIGVGSATAALGALGCAEATHIAQPAPEDTGAKLLGVSGVSFSATCDVLVVGSGIAGLSAAMDPSEAGLKVIVADKNTLLGGESYESSGMLQVYGAKIQKGVGSPKTSGDLFQERKEAFAERYPDAQISAEALLEAICAQRSVWVDRMVDTYHAQFWDPNDYVDDGIDQSILIPQSGLGGLDGIMNPMRDQLAAQGVEYLLGQELQAFITDGAGALCGARFFSPDSLAFTDVKASKIVLATGGFAANQHLFAENLPQLLHMGCWTSLSDGIAMQLAQRIGAATMNLDLAPDLLGDIPLADTWGCFAPMVAVDPNARRFTREDQRYTVPNACFEQDLGYWWLIFDQQMSEGPQSNSAAKTLEAYASRHVGPCESVEELAEAMGIDGDALKKSLSSYDKVCEEGTDEEFGRTAHLKKLAAPYHAVKQYPMRFRTVGGLHVNEQCQVLDGTGAPIAGLYAAGSCAAILSFGFLDNAASGLVAGSSIAQELATSAE